MDPSVKYEYEYRETGSGLGTSVEIVEILSGRMEETESSPKDRFLQVLDTLQKDTESLRNKALQLKEERDGVLTHLESLRHSKTLQVLDDVEKTEVENYIDMISQRCQTVNLMVQTPRNGFQEDSLFKVNTLIDSLVSTLRQDPDGMHGRCLAFMNSCCTRDEDEVLYAMVKGLQPLQTDRGFEEALLGCALDDQKNIKRRLRGLLDYIIHL